MNPSNKKSFIEAIGLISFYSLIYFSYYFSQVIEQPYLSYNLDTNLIELYRQSFYTNLILGTFVTLAMLIINLSFLSSLQNISGKFKLTGTIIIISILMTILLLIA